MNFKVDELSINEMPVKWIVGTNIYKPVGELYDKDGKCSKHQSNK